MKWSIIVFEELLILVAKSTCILLHIVKPLANKVFLKCMISLFAASDKFRLKSPKIEEWGKVNHLFLIYWRRLKSQSRQSVRNPYSSMDLNKFCWGSRRSSLNHHAVSPEEAASSLSSRPSSLSQHTRDTLESSRPTTCPPDWRRERQQFHL